MSVPEQTPYKEYIGNGVTTSFNLDFDCNDKDHLVVLVDDHEPLVGDWQLDNGAVIFKNTPKNGVVVKVQRNTPFRRDRDYQSYDNSFKPPTVNKDFDWIWLKLQELGVADWILGNRINALKNYVDRKDDELKAYLVEEIRKQGVALDQLDNYYNYLMKRLTQIAVDKGWEASFVVDGDENQHQINNKTLRFINTISDLISIKNPKDGQAVYVESIDSMYKYSLVPSMLSIDGWVLQFSDRVSTEQLNIKNGSDITNLLVLAKENNFFIALPDDSYFKSTVNHQEVLIGNGTIQYIYDYMVNDNTEHVAPKISRPYAKTQNSGYGWYDNVQARGNFEHGAGRGLIVNDDGARPQICGFRTKQQQKNYPSVDIAGQYTHIMSPKVETLTNCTFTSNSVTSASITSALDIKVGDFIVTDFDPAIGKPWRSEVTAIDLQAKKLSVTWWLHESGSGEGTPPNGLKCYTPYVNGLWGENTNVFIRVDDRVTTAIGYELGVASEKTRDKFTQIIGHYVVNLSSNTARAQTAYKVGGKWDQAILVDDCTAAVVTSGLGKYAVDYTANTDLDSAAVIMRNPLANGGNLTRSVSGLDVLYNVDFAGVQSALKLTYSIHSADIAYNGLQPSLCIGANSGGVAHTTTISTVRMFGGHILEFKQLEAVNWTIIAGVNTFVLNASGAMDYLKLLYDGKFFIKIFAGKSL